jgi:hypothetical protein
MGLIIGNLIVGGNASIQKPVETETVSFSQVRKVTEEKLELQTKEIQEETHVKFQDGELERLIPKKSSYMMDFTSGLE